MNDRQRLIYSLSGIGDDLIDEAARYRPVMRRALTAAAALLCAAVLAFAAVFAATGIRMQRSNAPQFFIVDGRIYKLRTGPAAVLAVMGLSFRGEKASVKAYTADSPNELSAAVKEAARIRAAAKEADNKDKSDVVTEPALTIFRANGGATVVFRLSDSREAYSPCLLGAYLGVEDSEAELGVTLAGGKWAAEPDGEQARELKSLMLGAASVGWADEFFDTNVIDLNGFLSKRLWVRIDLKSGPLLRSVYWLVGEGLLMSDDGVCFAPDEPERIDELIESQRPEPALPNKSH